MNKISVTDEELAGVVEARLFRPAETSATERLKAVFLLLSERFTNGVEYFEKTEPCPCGHDACMAEDVEAEDDLSYADAMYDELMAAVLEKKQNVETQEYHTLEYDGRDESYVPREYGWIRE